jgi:Holliday junction resolvase RusA-like endonuclease
MDSKSRDTPPGSVSFYVHATPKGKGRPRFSRDRWGRVYTRTPEDTRIFEDRVVTAYLEQVGATRQRPYFPKGVPLALSAEICFAPPESASKKKKLEMISGAIRPTKRPDADNVLKAIADSLNGLAYHDDAQVVEMQATKVYDAVEGVRVTIRPA